MTKKELTCIGCPMGCQLTVEMDGTKVVKVTGNTCNVGDQYARKELTNPTRIVTSTVCVDGGTIGMTSVKTKSDIPKGKIDDVIAELAAICVKAPVSIGDVVLSNVAGTGVDVVVTKNVPKE